MKRIPALVIPFLIGFNLILLVAALPADERTIYLKNGDQITGSVLGTDPQTGEILIRTRYGDISVSPDNILEEVVSIELISGDKVKGRILLKSEKETEILTDYGLLRIDNADIANIDYGLRDKGHRIAPLSDKFTLSNERQIDVFYDPTGYTLDKGILYFSGLSWGFGITDKFQVTSKWAGYFIGNFNVRPKLQLFRLGTFEKEHTFSVGGHIHTRHNPDKFEWLEAEYEFENGLFNPDSNYRWVATGGSTPVYFGGYYKIGSRVELEDNEQHFNTEYNEIEYNWVSVEEPDYAPYYELFAAYTFSKTRKNDTGRIAHTLGVIVGKHPEREAPLLKYYYAGGIDIRRNLILNYEVYYDPYYVEWWNRADGIFGIFEGNLTTKKPEKHWVSPFHFDVGFIYAFSDWLRFGIHFQPYIFGIYMKF